MQLTRFRTTKVLILLTTIIVLVLPLVSIWTSGLKSAFDFLAPDSFYYLTVAINWNSTGTFSYDGELPTNGFHPLWQWTLTLFAVLLKTLPDLHLHLLWLTFYLSLGLIAFGTTIILKTSAPLLPFRNSLLVYLPLGVTGCFLLFLWPGRSTIWTQINGMETGLSYFLFAILFSVTVHSPQRNFVKGVLVSALVLSRLDTIFFAGIYVLAEMYISYRNTRRLKDLVLIPGILLFSLTLYLTTNIWYSGMGLPVSGSTKSSFPQADFENINDMVDVLLGSQPHIFVKYWVAQLFIPFVLGIVYLLYLIKNGTLTSVLHQQKSRSKRFHLFLACSALYIIAYHSYNIFFVDLNHQGQWYYFLSQVVISLCYCQMVPSKYFRNRRVRFLTISSGAVIMPLLFISIYSAIPSNPYYKTFLDRHNFSKTYKNAYPKILEIDDGIIAYSTGASCLSGIGLALDKASAEAMKNNALLHHAYSRGYNRIASSYYITAPSWVNVGDDITRVMRKGTWPFRYDNYRYYVEYLPSDRSYIVIKFEPEPIRSLQAR